MSAGAGASAARAGGAGSARGAGGIAGEGQIIEVALQKGPDGLCIAFSEALPDDDEDGGGDAEDGEEDMYAGRGRVIVDPLDPFLARSDGSAGPAEASGCIRPADVLVAVNGQEVSQLHFDEVIELLRSLGYGNVLLRFMREPLSAGSP